MQRADVAREARVLRREAERQYSEVDLLVAALRDHVRDLQIERDGLLRELAATREAAGLRQSDWLWRGMKAAR